MGKINSLVLNIKEELIYARQNLVTGEAFSRLVTIKKKILTEKTMGCNFTSIKLSVIERDDALQYWLCWENLHMHKLQVAMQITVI